MHFLRPKKPERNSIGTKKGAPAFKSLSPQKIKPLNQLESD